jgi:hypothetical protein
MSQPYVSPYHELIIEAFDSGFDAALNAERIVDRTALVKKLVDEIWEQAVTQLHNSIDDYLGENLKDATRRRAAEVAEHMLRDALAGDDKQLRNLFGFNEWYMKHAYSGNFPTQWALLDVLIARRPDLLVDEKIRQQAREIELLKQNIGGLHRQIARLKGEDELTT